MGSLESHNATRTHSFILSHMTSTLASLSLVGFVEWNGEPSVVGVQGYLHHSPVAL